MRLQDDNKGIRNESEGEMNSITSHIIGGVAGLIIGSMICFLLGRWAYQKQYNREKRAERFKRELDIEAKEKRLFSSNAYTVYCNTKNGLATVVLDDSLYHGYLIGGKKGYGTTVEITMVIDIEQEIKK